MSKANKTQKTKASVSDFLNDILPEPKREDCLKILEMQRQITGLEPKLWGSIIGFGDYHYKYDSGREGDFFRLGFAPRAQNISIYIMPGYQDFDDEFARLGKYKAGKSCLYIKRLSDVDEDVLVEVMTKGFEIMEEKYPT